MATGKWTPPTGFEQQTQSLAQKRKIADALLERGLTGAPSYGSWAQVLGQLAQAWAGKSLGRDVDRGQTQLNSEMTGAYNDARLGLNNDAATMTPQDLVAKYGGNPMLSEDVKPYIAALQARLAGDQNLVNNGGQWMREGQIKEGSFQPNNPNNMVVRGPNGEWVVNPVAVGATSASQGWGTLGLPPVWKDPATSGPIPPQAAPSAPNPMANIPTGSPLSPAKAPSGQLPNGRPYWIINGEAYDNPEGR